MNNSLPPRIARKYQLPPKQKEFPSSSHFQASGPSLRNGTETYKYDNRIEIHKVVNGNTQKKPFKIIYNNPGDNKASNSSVCVIM